MQKMRFESGGKYNIPGFQSWVILTFILILGAAIRFYDLTHPALWLDELFSLNGSDPDQTLLQVYEYSKGDQPPVFFFILFGWLKFFGYTAFAARSLVAMYGILGIAAIYFLGKEIKNERLGLFLALLTAVNHFHASFSREVRFYPLVFVLSTLSFLFFIRCIKRGKIKDYAFYAFFTAALLNTHYYGLVVFVAQLAIFLIVVIVYKRTISFIVGGIVSGAIVGLSLIHWLPILLKDLQTPEFHVAPVDIFFPARFLWIYFKEVVTIAAAIVSLFVLIKTSAGKKVRETPIEYWVVVGWLLFGFFVPLLYSWLKFPLLTPKYSTITLPALYVIIGLGFLRLLPRIQVYFVSGILAGSLLTLFIFKPINQPRVTEDWKDVATYFSTNVHSKPTVFAQLAYFHIFYFKTLQYDGQLPIDQRFCDFNSLIDKSDEVWLLKHDRYADQGFLPEQRKLIDSLFIRVDSVVFDETKGFLFKRK